MISRGPDRRAGTRRSSNGERAFGATERALGKRAGEREVVVVVEREKERSIYNAFASLQGPQPVEAVNVACISYETPPPPGYSSQCQSLSLVRLIIPSANKVNPREHSLPCTASNLVLPFAPRHFSCFAYASMYTRAHVYARGRSEPSPVRRNGSRLVESRILYRWDVYPRRKEQRLFFIEGLQLRSTIPRTSGVPIFVERLRVPRDRKLARKARVVAARQLGSERVTRAVFQVAEIRSGVNRAPRPVN